jgi:cell division protease FtsH
MVTEYGMSEALGPMRFGHPQGEVFLGRDLTSTPDYSDEVAASIDLEVRALIEAAHGAAGRVLVENRLVLDRIASELIQHETLEAEQVQAILAGVQPLVRDDARPGSSRAGAAAASSTDPSRQQPHRGPAT